MILLEFILFASLPSRRPPPTQSSAPPCSLSPLVGRTNIKPKNYPKVNIPGSIQSSICHDISKVQYVKIYPKFNMSRSIQSSICQDLSKVQYAKIYPIQVCPLLACPPSHSPPSTISSPSPPVVLTNKRTCSDYYCNTIGYNTRMRYIHYDSQHSLLSNTYNTACSALILLRFTLNSGSSFKYDTS